MSPAGVTKTVAKVKSVIFPIQAGAVTAVAFVSLKKKKKKNKKKKKKRKRKKSDSALMMAIVTRMNAVHFQAKKVLTKKPTAWQQKKVFVSHDCFKP